MRPLLALLLLDGGLTPLFACFCAPPPPNLKTARDVAEWRALNSAAVFEGSVEKAELKSRVLDAPVGTILPANLEGEGPPLLVTFSVSRTYRGEARRSVQVETGLGGGDCGFPFILAKQYLVFSRREEPGRLATGICSGTALLEDSQANLAYLRGEPVPESVPVRAERATGQLCVRIEKDGTTQNAEDNVLLMRVDAVSPMQFDVAESDGKGFFCAAHLEPGKYLLLFAAGARQSPTGFAYYPGVADADKATSVDVQAGQALSLVFHVPRQTTYSVRGKVVIRVSTRMPDSQVALVAAERPLHGLGYATDVNEDGSFYFPKVLAGRYWGFVAVDDEGWSMKKAELVVDRDLAGVALVLIPAQPAEKR